MSRTGKLEIFCGNELFFCARQRGSRYMIAAVQSCKFMLPSLSVKSPDMCIGPAAPLLFLDQEIIIGHGSNLRQMGDAHDLLAL